MGCSPNFTLLCSRSAVAEFYRPAFDRVIRFGSLVRGDAREDSDLDVAVSLKDVPNRWAGLRRLAALRNRFIDQGPLIQAIPFRAADYDKRTPVAHGRLSPTVTVGRPVTPGVGNNLRILVNPAFTRVAVGSRSTVPLDSHIAQWLYVDQ